MSNEEILTNDVKYLRDFGLNLSVYRNLSNFDSFILEANGMKTNFTAKDLKAYLQSLKDELGDLEDLELKKRRQFRSLLLEASEQLAKKYNKQVYTLSIGDVEND